MITTLCAFAIVVAGQYVSEIVFMALPDWSFTAVDSTNNMIYTL